MVESKFLRDPIEIQKAMKQGYRTTSTTEMIETWHTMEKYEETDFNEIETPEQEEERMLRNREFYEKRKRDNEVVKLKEVPMSELEEWTVKKNWIVQKEYTKPPRARIALLRKYLNGGEE